MTISPATMARADAMFSPATQDAITSMYAIGVGFTALVVLYDGWLCVSDMYKTQSSDQYTKNYYMRLIIHLHSWVNNALLSMYCTPLIYDLDYAILPLPALGFIVESIVIGMVFWYLPGKKKRAIASGIATMFGIALAMVILVALLHYSTTDSRGKWVGTIIIVTSFLFLSAMAYDLRSIMDTEAASELSIFNCIFGLLGSAMLCVYGFLSRKWIVMSRHCIAILGNIVLLSVIWRRSSASRTDMELEIQAPSVPDLESQSSTPASDPEPHHASPSSSSASTTTHVFGQCPVEDCVKVLEAEAQRLSQLETEVQRLEAEFQHLEAEVQRLSQLEAEVQRLEAEVQHLEVEVQRLSQLVGNDE
ncbi:hypothetical protein LINPERPRIM_LOCUS28298 [Linum perenne]